MYKTSFAVAFLTSLLFFSTDIAYGWHAKTHKYLAQRAVEFLHGRSSGDFFERYENDLLKGCVEADRNWGNTKHHMIFDENGEVRSYVAADFVEEVSEEAVAIIHEARRSGQITPEDEAEFAELCGYVVHVITDVAGAYHVIWGEKQSDHHKYEKGVDDVVTVTSSGDFESEEFEINFDGVLREDIDPYTAVMETATTTYFGRRSILPAEKIEREMEMSNGNVDNWSKKIRKSTRMSMRAATNRAAEALEKLYKMAFEEPLADSTVLDMEIPEVDQE